jgi:hypothetical protein
MKFHKDGTLPQNGEIFVFGSNLGGIHGAGAVSRAARDFGAQYGIGQGMTGNSYAIPTKNGRIKTLPIKNIVGWINKFLEFAYESPKMEFFVTRIGCGLAAYTDKEIAPYFFEAPRNCSFAEEWKPYLKTD